MFDIRSIVDLAEVRESVDTEFKLAAGRDGRGALPQDFWPSYSAFANTEGGVVVLGVCEKRGEFSVEGIADVAKVRKELFDQLNDRHKVSVNLLKDADVREVRLEDRSVLVVEIPRATRKQRPVHLTANPFGGTYVRLNDGDRRVPDDAVKRMLAEQVEDERDARILRGYGRQDLDAGALRAYRQIYANRNPEHPFTALADTEFLHKIGGWRQDRETGESGLTLAGLLMFGSMAIIHEVLPKFMLDYQERPETESEMRWIDRVTLDGRWSGNLYDFYRIVYPKLVSDLKVPFVLEGDERRDETRIHEALREALVNTLVHADYFDHASIRVLKMPDRFSFRNPGLMRVPASIALRGGESDCRNRTLQKMFRFVGLGEQAGSGIPKIVRSWADRHWQMPILEERREPYEQTLFELHMVDLLPGDLLEHLRRTFGPSFDSLARNERMAVAEASAQKLVSHARVREMTALHPVDVTHLLQRLVRQGFLERHNPGRGAVYSLPGTTFPSPEEVYGIDADSAHRGVNSAHMDASSAHLDASSAHLDASSAHLRGKVRGSVQRDAKGCIVTGALDAPLIASLEDLPPPFLRELEALATAPRVRRKLPPEEMREAILAVCRDRYVQLECLANLVNRSPSALRQQHLRPMLQSGSLRLAFPDTQTHRLQAYRTAEPPEPEQDS